MPAGSLQCELSPNRPLRSEAARGINCTHHLLNDSWLYVSFRRESLRKDLALKNPVAPPEGQLTC